MWTRAFWTDVLERTGSSIIIFTATLLINPDVVSGGWLAIVRTVGTAAVVTLAKTLLASQVGQRGTAGFVSLPQPTGRHASR